jgi:hypothetical protein
MIWDEPNILFGGHPSFAIETAQIHRPRVTAQGAFAPQVKVDVKVTQSQLA